LSAKLINNVVNNCVGFGLFNLYLPKLHTMSARTTILKLAKEKEVRSVDLARAMKYDHVNSFYRALISPGQISYRRIKALAKALGVTTCELITILK